MIFVNAIFIVVLGFVLFGRGISIAERTTRGESTRALVAWSVFAFVGLVLNVVALAIQVWPPKNDAATLSVVFASITSILSGVVLFSLGDEVESAQRDGGRLSKSPSARVAFNFALLILSVVALVAYGWAEQTHSPAAPDSVPRTVTT